MIDELNVFISRECGTHVHTGDRHGIPHLSAVYTCNSSDVRGGCSGYRVCFCGSPK